MSQLTAVDAHGAASQAGLPSRFSAYLDLVRLSAAAMVVLHHLKHTSAGPDAVLRFIPAYGHEFVIVFFVLSGYVIAATVDRKRDDGLRDYALDRAARMYSVVLPTLLVSTLLSLFMWLASAPGSGTLQEIFTAAGLNLIFLAQSWGVNSIPPSNPAFWSLSYEVMYYALFGCLYYLRGGHRLAMCALVAMLAGPKVLLLLPCWLAGVAAYHWRDRLRTSRSVAWFMLMSPVIVMAALSYVHFGASMRVFLGQVLGFYYERLDWSMEFPKDYIGAVLIASHLHAVRRLGLKLPARVGSAAVNGAALTFTLYLLHYPVIVLIKLAFGSANRSLACFVTAALGVVVATYVVGSFSEARRRQFRTLLAKRVAPMVSAA